VNDTLGASSSGTPLVIVGAGGHGREVLDVVRAVNSATPTWDLLGFVADGGGDLEEIEALGVSFLGPISELEVDRGYGKDKLGAPRFVVAIGAGAVRRSIDERLTKAGLVPASVIHPSATVGAHCELAPGVVIVAGARVTTNVRLGRHVHLNLNSTVSHDSVLGDYVTISSGVNISGRVTLGAGVDCGAGSTVLPGVHIGSGTRVGAGAVVTKDCPPDCTMVGVPAHPLPQSAQGGSC
jgi:sugar O-acyltransferase (sialic acid O-acetyltransferase NeuD family)